MDTFRYNNFIFSSKYRIWRHVAFWFAFTLLTGLIYFASDQGLPLSRQLLLGVVWLPVRILYCYPLMYWVFPKFLLKEKYVQLGVIVFLWFAAGWFINYLFRVYFFIPFQEYFHFKTIIRSAWMPGSFLLLTTAAGLTSIISLFKYWFVKQQQWMQAEKEKVTAELQLLKAQVHPHFLFNTLNNIYSFSLENSPKTPGLILKLSSLLSYMLYDCKSDEVLLEKEVEIMRNYIDLEKERYGNKIDISWNVEGDVRDKYLTPLLLLPFLENAFKHGTSEQLEKPWLSVDISVSQNMLQAKIANSKNEDTPFSNHGIGIQNVKKRLSFLYPDKHELKMNDEGNFFVVSLLIDLKSKKTPTAVSSPVNFQIAENVSL